MFDPDAFESFGAKLDPLRESLARSQALAARKSDTANVKSELAELTATPCDQLDVAEVGRRASTLHTRYPKEAVTVDAQLTQWIARCSVEIGQIDHTRARLLRQQALLAFADAPALTELKLDPCGVLSLVGKGASPGGFCADDLGGGINSPPLVVVADGDHRFAISKFEVSFADMNPFCAETLRCNSPTAATMDRPATSVSVEQAVAYAAWLSQRSGQIYRLPSRAEWERVARAGWPDPNRNCRPRTALFNNGRAPVAVSVGAENELGVVNVLGNVREWVMDGDAPLAMGGSYADSISKCDISDARPGSPQGNAQTGLRLVREVR